MLQITETTIISVDKSDESWAIEGEMVFDDDLASAFEVTYSVEEDELEGFSLELELEGEYNTHGIKDIILQAVEEFED